MEISETWRYAPGVRGTVFGNFHVAMVFKTPHPRDGWDHLGNDTGRAKTRSLNRARGNHMKL